MCTLPDILFNILIIIECVMSALTILTFRVFLNTFLYTVKHCGHFSWFKKKQLSKLWSTHIFFKEVMRAMVLLSDSYLGERGFVGTFVEHFCNTFFILVWSYFSFSWSSQRSVGLSAKVDSLCAIFLDVMFNL